MGAASVAAPSPSASSSSSSTAANTTDTPPTTTRSSPLDSLAALKAALTTYRNPILPGWNPDPTVCNVPGKGYFLATGSGEYSPGLPVYHSIDLFTWELLGHAIKRVPAVLGAPTLRYNAGHWYMAVSSGTDGTILIVSSPDIFDESRWSEPFAIQARGTEPDLFFDHGVAHISYTSAGQRCVVSINTETGANLSPVDATPTTLALEGRLMRRAGWYYMLTVDAAQSVSVYRSRDIGIEEDEDEPPTLPADVQWEAAPHNPVLDNGDHADVRGTVSVDIVRGERGWSAIFSATRSRSAPSSARGSREASIAGGSEGTNGAAPEWCDSHLGAETYMAPVEWRDGWPVINGGARIELVGNAEGMRLLPERDEWVDEFDRDALSIGWYVSRGPVYTVGRGLAISPSNTAPAGAPPPMLLQRQLAFNADWETRVHVPSSGDVEAGTALCAGREWAAIGVRGGAAPAVVFRLHAGGEAATEVPLVGSGPVTLRIRARRDEYEFAYVAGQETVLLGTVPSAAVAVEGSGVHLGLYAVGEGEGGAPVRFEYARCERVEV